MHILNNYPLSSVTPHIDWGTFIHRWETAGQRPALANPRRVLDRAWERFEQDARALLDRIVRDNLLQLRGVIRFFPALSSHEDVLLYRDAERAEIIGHFHFPRSLRVKQEGEPNPCLADFIMPLNRALPTVGRDGQPFPKEDSPYEINVLPLAPDDLPFEIEGKPFAPNEPSFGLNGLRPVRFDTLGLFALSAGFGLDALQQRLRAESDDDYRAILAASLADSLVEAWSSQMHGMLARTLEPATQQYAEPDGIVEPDGSYGIRPAFGFPCCPDHEDKRLAFKLLGAEEHCGLELTDSAMIRPAASVCGLYFLNPCSFYFTP